jgi:hypothetical protein
MANFMLRDIYSEPSLGSTKLFDGLFMGDVRVAQDARFLSNHIIRLVITVNPDKSFAVPSAAVREEVDFEYYCWQDSEKVVYIK